MGGYSAMLSILWRGNRRQILGWVLGLAGVFAATAWSMNDLYPTQADIAAYAQATESGSALFAINGKPFGLDTIGGLISYEFGFVSALAFPLLGVHLVLRMTRGEEQSGRMELLRAGSIGRTATVGAALTLTAAGVAVIGSAMSATLFALDVGWPGAVAYPAAMALLGFGFAALAAAVAQVVATARAGTAACLAVLVVAFLARGVGDVRDNALVWLSPIGWAEQTRAFAGARWWPLLLAVGFAAAMAVLAGWFAERRDLGQGLFASRRGPSSAAANLLRPMGFAIRGHRGPVLAWSIIGALVGIAFGSLADAIRTLMEDNEAMQDIFGGGSADEDAYLAFVVILLALISAGYALQGIGRVAEEEAGDRLEPILAGTCSRTRWLAAQAITVAAGAAIVTAVSGLALGISDAVAISDPSAVGRITVAALAYLPAVLVLLTFAVALYGLHPPYLAAGWAVYIAVAVIAVLADTLQLPDWVRHLSPLDWVGRTPIDPVRGWGLVAALLLAGVFAIAGGYGLQHRDVPTRRGIGVREALALRRSRGAARA
ncbi:ABC transporter permease [Nocardia mexicana]|uniref:ABC-2 type transport system permease protein n=1 Tax=Nocardia mexicana TaxID=279262 RepID=A0A370H170_9NOCA|nr:hypothetical protein [Nocardia mexicana]RDI49597.1 ABC-2 type transport system permease protein [Nocardia mexicana]